MKADIIKTLEKRAEHFDSIHHSYESREIWSAIDVIERLMPPELFSIPVFVGLSEQLNGFRDFVNKSKHSQQIYNYDISEYLKTYLMDNT